MNKIRHVFATIVGLMGLSACHQDSPKQQSDFVPITKMQSNDARNAIEELIGEEGQSIFICGGSDGVGIFSIAWRDGFTSDGIKDGRLVFVQRPKVGLDVIYRDVTGRYASSHDAGAEIFRILTGKGQTWVVSYRQTGVVETHNITEIEGNLIDLWTNNKPVSPVGAKANLFRAQCIRS